MAENLTKELFDPSEQEILNSQISSTADKSELVDSQGILESKEAHYSNALNENVTENGLSEEQSENIKENSKLEENKTDESKMSHIPMKSMTTLKLKSPRIRDISKYFESNHKETEKNYAQKTKQHLVNKHDKSENNLQPPKDDHASERVNEEELNTDKEKNHNDEIKSASDTNHFFHENSKDHLLILEDDHTNDINNEMSNPDMEKIDKTPNGLSTEQSIQEISEDHLQPLNHVDECNEVSKTDVEKKHDDQTQTPLVIKQSVLKNSEDHLQPMDHVKVSNTDVDKTYTDHEQATLTTNESMLKISEDHLQPLDHVDECDEISTADMKNTHTDETQAGLATKQPIHENSEDHSESPEDDNDEMSAIYMSNMLNKVFKPDSPKIEAIMKLFDPAMIKIDLSDPSLKAEQPAENIANNIENLSLNLANTEERKEVSNSNQIEFPIPSPRNVLNSRELASPTTSITEETGNVKEITELFNGSLSNQISTINNDLLISIDPEECDDLEESLETNHTNLLTQTETSALQYLKIKEIIKRFDSLENKRDINVDNPEPAPLGQELAENHPEPEIEEFDVLENSPEITDLIVNNLSPLPKSVKPESPNIKEIIKLFDGAPKQKIIINEHRLNELETVQLLTKNIQEEETVTESVTVNSNISTNLPEKSMNSPSSKIKDIIKLFDSNKNTKETKYNNKVNVEIINTTELIPKTNDFTCDNEKTVPLEQDKNVNENINSNIDLNEMRLLKLIQEDVRKDHCEIVFIKHENINNMNETEFPDDINKKTEEIALIQDIKYVEDNDKILNITSVDNIITTKHYPKLKNSKVNHMISLFESKKNQNEYQKNINRAQSYPKNTPPQLKTSSSYKGTKQNIFAVNNKSAPIMDIPNSEKDYDINKFITTVDNTSNFDNIEIITLPSEMKSYEEIDVCKNNIVNYSEELNPSIQENGILEFQNKDENKHLISDEHIQLTDNMISKSETVDTALSTPNLKSQLPLANKPAKMRIPKVKNMIELFESKKTESNYIRHKQNKK